MDHCSNCYYNFDGICANHCYFEVYLPMSGADLYVDSEFDPYGKTCNDLPLLSFCDGFRQKPSFLIPLQKD